MKKKSPRGIPDFSHKRPITRTAEPGDVVRQAPAPRVPVPPIKPQSTSAKSGRRGQ